MRSRSFFDGSELDDGPNSGSTGPAFSTPYQERIRAARADNVRNAPQPSSQEADPTEALKKFLFSGMKSNNANQPSKSSLPGAASFGSPASPPNNGTAPRTQNIQAMENDLRRILKMDDSNLSSQNSEGFTP